MTIIAGAIAVAFVSAAFAGDVVQVRQRCTLGGDAVAETAPHAGPGLSAPALHADHGARAVSAGGADWQLMSVPGGIYLRAVSMASSQVGFASGELGKVLRTTDGGDTWSYVLNQGFPYYWYGCQTLDEQTVIVAGFQNQTGEGIIRWTLDGGSTWGPVIALTGAAGIQWLAHVEFIDAQNGIVEAAWSGAVHRTATGGMTALDWTSEQPSSAWFLGTFTYLDDQRVWLAGIDVVHSTDGGDTWTTLPSTSAIFDGPIAVRDDNVGYVGGGTISPTVSGWIYKTADGGSTWSDGPVATTPYPVRGLVHLDEQRGWAACGNVFSGTGGIWGTQDGGETWSLEQDIGHEMIDFDIVRVDDDFVDVYAVGMVSQIWRARVSSPVGSPCPWDLDDDGSVGTSDLLDLLAAWGTNPGGPPDFDGDGSVGTSDLLELLANWGACP